MVLGGQQKKLGDGKGRIALVSPDEFWHVQLKENLIFYPGWLSFSIK